MTAPRIRLGSLVAAIAVLALPSTASAESLVPPGNSAAAQYTEAFPTAGGQKQAKNATNGHKPSPAKVLGADNARKLEHQGPQGHAAAEVAAATAPPAPPAEAPQPSSENPARADGGAGGGTGGGGKPDAAQPDAASREPIFALDEGEGSGGVSEVIGNATGSSSSNQGAGLLLPLVVLGTIAWSVAILWRRNVRRARTRG